MTSCLNYLQLEEELTKLREDFQSVTLDADFKLNEQEAKYDALLEEKKELEANLSEQKS